LYAASVQQRRLALVRSVVNDQELAVKQGRKRLRSSTDMRELS
jgi:hypothetical protein